ncbi:UV DNA damage endonuclease [Alteribacillus bidgolensis]|uniref:UV DNA damage endonuclease n=1 Tax=Alteribacillus bidgolensis TaxID=930129 RepID=A0A1G8CIB3_9BACI|nr:UV DNA damage endonuclease [Alteribacillus bidgolensis]
MNAQERNSSLYEITKKNLEHTICALHFNIAHGIKLYRFSSSLIPLAAHQKVEWDYLSPFLHLYKEIGELVKQHGIRTSFHPNQFTLFTSNKPYITANAVNNMKYHYHLLDAMNLSSEAYINLHVGGAYGTKSAAVNRFYTNLQQLPLYIKKTDDSRK